MNLMQSALWFLLRIGTGTKDLWLYDSMLVVSTLVGFYPHSSSLKGKQ